MASENSTNTKHRIVKGISTFHLVSVQAPESKLWLCVGRCANATTEVNVANHLKSSWPDHLMIISLANYMKPKNGQKAITERTYYSRNLNKRSARS